MGNCNRLVREDGTTGYGEGGVETGSVTSSMSDGLATPVADVVEYGGPGTGNDLEGESV